MRSLVACCLFAATVVTAAHAGWGPQGSTILSTTDAIREVEACADGDYGTYVVFNQAGVLRAMHVLPTGDPDPAWPAGGLVVCAVNTTRAHTAVHDDGLGGAYVSWMEGLQVFATRFTSGAEIAAGWPARGRLIETFPSTHPAPSVARDADGGLVLAWERRDLGTIRIARYSPANGVYAGWPASGMRTVAEAGQDEGHALRWPRVAADDDGGFYLAWGSVSSGGESDPSLVRVRHVDVDGWPVDGWPSPDPSRPLGTIDQATLAGLVTVPASPLDVANDGIGGAFLFAGQLTSEMATLTATRIHRLEADGDVAAGWPAEGITTLLNGAMMEYFTSGGPALDLTVRADGVGGAFIGFPFIYTEGFAESVFNRHGLGGDFFLAGSAWGHEVAPLGTGGMSLATFKASGPLHIFDGPAFLELETGGMPSEQLYFEMHEQPAIPWFGDIGLTATKDGGNVFFWSQENELEGLFAKRFTEGGLVTGVEPGVSHLGLGRVRFVAGAGVCAAVSIEGSARLELFDLAGRRLVSQEVASAGEYTLAGTRDLAAGLYFARLSAADGAASAKVMVAR